MGETSIGTAVVLSEGEYDTGVVRSTDNTFVKKCAQIHNDKECAMRIDCQKSILKCGLSPVKQSTLQAPRSVTK